MPNLCRCRNKTFFYNMNTQNTMIIVHELSNIDSKKLTKCIPSHSVSNYNMHLLLSFHFTDYMDIKQQISQVPMGLTLSRSLNKIKKIRNRFDICNGMYSNAALFSSMHVRNCLQMHLFLIYILLNISYFKGPNDATEMLSK